MNEEIKLDNCEFKVDTATLAQLVLNDMELLTGGDSDKSLSAIGIACWALGRAGGYTAEQICDYIRTIDAQNGSSFSNEA